MGTRYGIEAWMRTINDARDDRWVTLYHKNLLNEVRAEIGYVYLFHMDETPWYKIGKSIDPKKRLRELQPTRLPTEIKLLHQISTNYMSELEEILHKRFVDKSKRGEWFLLTPSDIQSIKFIKTYKSDVITEAKIALYAYQQRSGIDLNKWTPPPVTLSKEALAIRKTRLNKTTW
jgi:hypothetical protein